MLTVFALGSNGSGQLGIGHSEDVSVPKPVLWERDVPGTITSVAAGGNHTLLLCGDGLIYWAGDPSNGACGSVVPSYGQPSQPHFTELKIGRPEDTIKSSGPVRKISATWSASVFAMPDKHGKNTRVYTCGLGEKGELGQGPFIVRDPHGTELTNFPPAGAEVADIAACMDHVVAVLSNGDVYGWGNGRKGQLGSPHVPVFSPRRIEGIDFPVKRAVCGKDFTCLLGERERGQMQILGLDKWNIRSKAPPAVPGWKDVGAGWSNIFILMGNGEVVSWGRDNYSLGIFPSPQKALKIAAGSEHALALLESGDVVAWGWGEHGNCGPVKRGEAAKGQRNTIVSSKLLPSDTHILAIGAGCATSWIFIGNDS